MATVRVDKKHTLGRDGAKAAVDQFAGNLAKYGMKLVWSGFEGTLKGTGASGSVSISDDTVAITVKLGLLAKAAGVDAKRLEGSIGRRLEEALGGDATA